MMDPVFPTASGEPFRNCRESASQMSGPDAVRKEVIFSAESCRERGAGRDVIISVAHSSL